MREKREEKGEEREAGWVWTWTIVEVGATVTTETLCVALVLQQARGVLSACGAVVLKALPCNGLLPAHLQIAAFSVTTPASTTFCRVL